MNEHIHEVINKFNNINLACGTLALELESQRASADKPPKLKERIGRLLEATAEDLRRSHQLLAEITATPAEKSDPYPESEHFIRVIEPILAIIEVKRSALKNIISGGEGKPLPQKEIIGVLHTIEEKALACAVILKELRNALIKSGRCKVQRT